LLPGCAQAMSTTTSADTTPEKAPNTRSTKQEEGDDDLAREIARTSPSYVSGAGQQQAGENAKAVVVPSAQEAQKEVENSSAPSPTEGSQKPRESLTSTTVRVADQPEIPPWNRHGKHAVEKCPFLGCSVTAQVSELFGHIVVCPKRFSLRGISNGPQVQLFEASLGAQGTVSIAATLEENRGMEGLTLQGAEIGDKGMKFLAWACQRSRSLRTVDLAWNHVGAAGCYFLGFALRDNPSITSLCMTANPIGDAGLANLCAGFKHIQMLSLAEAEIGDTGAQLLGPVLGHELNVVRWVNLANNSIGDKGAAALGRAMCTARKLQGLDLRRNKFGNQGAVGVAVGLEVSTSLHWLQLHGNLVGDEGVQALVAAIRKNPALKQMGLSLSASLDENCKRSVKNYVANVSFHWDEGTVPLIKPADDA